MKRTHTAASPAIDHDALQATGRAARDPFLTAMGERVRMLRARCGMTRKALANETGLSERHLANLESGVGNPSVQALRQIAATLNCPLAEVTGDVTTSSSEWLLIRELLDGRDAVALQQARIALAGLFAQAPRDPHRSDRVALIGLRGAGKSALGRPLAQQWKAPFVELTRVIGQQAGCAASGILALYGADAYQHYQQRALETVIAEHPRAVIALPADIVCAAATFDRLLAHCFTVWLQAAPEEHLRRGASHADVSPAPGHHDALDDVTRLLARRCERYGRADMTFDTSGKTLADASQQLRERLAARIAAEASGDGELIG